MSAGVVLISCSAIGFIIWTIQLAKNTPTIWNFSKIFCVFAIMAYSGSMFASSFVEEEHMTWYYIVQTISVLSVIHR